MKKLILKRFVLFEQALLRKHYPVFLLLITLVLLSRESVHAQQKTITGTVTFQQKPLTGVSVKLKGANTGMSTNEQGKYTVSLPTGRGVLVFTYIGFLTKEVIVEGGTTINVELEEDKQQLTEVVVTGYGTQKRESITGAISTVTSKDLEKVHGGSQVSTGLAGKLPGVTFRMPDGRPGGGATIQVRNMGNPLFVIDGIQQDKRQFDNLAPSDIESITVLKDASAAVYGVRAANGVVVVTTKRGSRGEKNVINIDTYAGFQNWSRFPDVVNDSYEWYLGKADAEMNNGGTTTVTKEELAKYKEGTAPGYQSFNWKDFIVQKNAPLYQQAINATGGSDRINYYFSGTNMFQYSVLGREFTYGRKNINANMDANITDRLKVGIGINGWNEVRDNPGIPGGDDYNLPRAAILWNRPWERPYANDNPDYINDIGHNESNWAYNNKKYGGYSNDRRRYGSARFNAQYQIPYIKGLVAQGSYSYGLEDRLHDGHEYTYKTYTYNPTDDTYKATGGSINPWRERRTQKIEKNNYQVGLNYNNTFGKHTVGGLLISERYDVRDKEVFVHAVPATNVLPLIYFNTTDTYNDRDDQQARIGYIGKINYNYANKYYLEFSGRRDASWKFAPDKRVGFFPSVSGGWRITEEKFMKSLLGENSKLNDLKIRASYGVLGDDDNGILPTDYLAGYNYNQNGYGILDGNPIIGSRDKGKPILNISWFKSKILDIGADFTMFNNKLIGSVDYFKRLRTGLRGTKYDIVLPSEIGFNLSDENINKDEQAGGEISLAYNGSAGAVTFSVGGNVGYARSKFTASYKPIFFNSWDQYRNSAEGRYKNLFWAYDVVGQFQSQEEINNYPINIDGQGNKTLLPGDLIYKDLNGDGKIDGYDERPLGYGRSADGTNQPIINGGFNFSVAWKGFDFAADFSIGSMYSYNQENEIRRGFSYNSGALNTILTDRWRRADAFDLNSEWIPGKYPALRFNVNSASSVNKNSIFWLHNVTAIRARTLELGYSLPKSLIGKINIQKARLFVNGYNLFSIDNLSKYKVDSEVQDTNGLQYPQNSFVNMGINLTL
ncbi:SusC/RagA family TonB-linked outer membrane protein [Pedobacter panaciterrae]|uniref:SusC/RagA family TonB-linked outer membrane protein n=1 Tax=Pedobacter panaciterrae TaxID=363849 RepID=A0ABU8NNI3_9SPHI